MNLQEMTDQELENLIASYTSAMCINGLSLESIKTLAKMYVEAREEEARRVNS